MVQLLRETPELFSALGLPIPLPLVSPQYLACPNIFTKQLVLFDLLVDDAAGFTVAQIEQSLWTAAVSANGDSLCLGGGAGPAGGLWVFDTAALVAAAGRAGEPTQLVPHRAQNTQLLSGVTAAAFSEGGEWLYATCRDAALTVHDARDERLPVLRTLPLLAPSNYMYNYTLACAGGMLAAVGDEAGG
eukprot:SAG31_NODE_11072_length_1069_cov_1.254639_1_plen_187_part_10